MKQYRIYTEDKNEGLIVNKVNEYFDAYTIYYTVGYWKRQKEHSLIIEIIDEDLMSVRNKVLAAANNIKKLNNQEAVLVTVQEIECITV